MPRKKKVPAQKPATRIARRRRVAKPEIIEHLTPRQGITGYAKDSFHWAESYTSLLMGVVVIVIAVLVVVSIIRVNRHIQETSSTATGPAEAPITTGQKTFPRTYVVRTGDDLWHIAEKEYGSGYNWVDIARVNKLDNPGMIFSGNKIVLPKISPTPTAITPTPSPLAKVVEKQAINAIKGDTYTVQKGDDLWNIAIRVYGDGYKWVDIARTNHLANPDLIFSGNVLVLPR